MSTWHEQQRKKRISRIKHITAELQQLGQKIKPAKTKPDAAPKPNKV